MTGTFLTEKECYLLIKTTHFLYGIEVIIIIDKLFSLKHLSYAIHLLSSCNINAESQSIIITMHNDRLMTPTAWSHSNLGYKKLISKCTKSLIYIKSASKL